MKNFKPLLKASSYNTVTVFEACHADPVKEIIEIDFPDKTEPTGIYHMALFQIANRLGYQTIFVPGKEKLRLNVSKAILTQLSNSVTKEGFAGTVREKVPGIRQKSIDLLFEQAKTVL